MISKNDIIMKQNKFSDNSILYLRKSPSLEKYDLGYYRIVYEVNGRKSGAGMFYKHEYNKALKEYDEQVLILKKNIGD